MRSFRSGERSWLSVDAVVGIRHAAVLGSENGSWFDGSWGKRWLPQSQRQEKVSTEADSTRSDSVWLILSGMPQLTA